MNNLQQPPIGIDLGTTFSAVAFVDNQGRPTTIENSEGQTTTPSIVFFDRDGVIVGSEAELAGEVEPDRLARLAKRDMGGPLYGKKMANRSLRPEVIQSLVLNRLKSDAELRVGAFEKAVITVPAYFNEPRRKATQDAGMMAGLDVIDIINEPTAAALAYGVQRGFLTEKGAAHEDETVLVYDLGGGTFDVTLMKICGSEFSAIATAGDVYLGGVDWDRAIFDFAVDALKKKHGIDCLSDPAIVEKLMRECNRAKKSLTARSETIIRIDADGKRISLDFSRKQFESVSGHLLERTRLTTDRLLDDAKTDWNKLTKLILVGGSTRMPMVPAMLERESGLKVDRSISPDKAVAHGAAIYAGILMEHGSTAGKGITVDNVNSHDLGVLGIDPRNRQPRRKVIIPRNHRLPASRTSRFQTSKAGQAKVIVQVVEGGTDTGQGATHIGKCVVDQLPGDLPQGTEVLVQFSYSSSGRLEVVAQLPKLDRRVATSINRAQGLEREELQKWRELVLAGFRIDDVDVDSIMSNTQSQTSQPSKSRKKPTTELEARSPAAKASPVDRPPQVEPQATEPDSTTGQQVPKNLETVESTKDSDLDKHSIDFQVFAKIAPEKTPKRDDATLSQIRVDGPDVGPRPSDVLGSEIINELSLTEQSARELASESMLDFLGDEAEKEKASASDTSLNDFLKGLDS